ncbi:hypothetical protein [Streptomyces nojiriensis]
MPDPLRAFVLGVPLVGGFVAPAVADRLDTPGHVVVGVGRPSQPFMRWNG